MENKKLIEEYQCTGCVKGPFEECFIHDKQGDGFQCDNHSPGTFANFGLMFLSMPTGFNRIGKFKPDMKMFLFKTLDECGWFDKFNIPVWKHLNEHGHTIVRGLRPRINQPFLMVIMEDCMDRIDCLEITKEDIKSMD